MTLDNRHRDYRWSLVYEGGTKVYRLTEARYVEGDWLTLNTTEWQRMVDALAYIDHTNTRRLLETPQT